MINENSFDEVHDCQEAFRKILFAVSNPGLTVSIADQANKLQTSKSVFLTIALSLLDKETSYCVLDDEDLSQTISDLTYSNKTGYGDPEKSTGFIFVTEKCGSEEMEGIIDWAFPGTLIEPHTSSTLVIGIDGFENFETCRLKGPGIKDSIGAGLPEYAKAWVRQRDLMGYEFPTGIDLYFAALSGDLLMIPRKVKMEG
jgi:alpha-D-ribose 1-methylphosphonate 5-triphosphate synthase subunit PhnH